MFQNPRLAAPGRKFHVMALPKTVQGLAPREEHARPQRHLKSGNKILDVVNGDVFPNRIQFGLDEFRKDEFRHFDAVS
jgi:hypothetical protein